MKLKLAILVLLVTQNISMIQPILAKESIQELAENSYTVPLLAGIAALVGGHYLMKRINNWWIDRTICDKEEKLRLANDALASSLPDIETSARDLKHDYSFLDFKKRFNVLVDLPSLAKIEDPGSINFPITVESTDRWFRTISNFFSWNVTIKSNHPCAKKASELRKNIGNYNSLHRNSITEYKTAVKLHDSFYPRYKEHCISIADYVQKNNINTATSSSHDTKLSVFMQEKISLGELYMKQLGLK